MRDTAELILDTAQELIQTRGFSAMSFQDIAARVGIRKPSIVHHFPSKDAIGTAVVRRYRERFDDALAAVEADPQKSPWDAMEFYFTPYLEFAGTPDKVCLCGALAGEMMALAPSIRAEVTRFFAQHEAWLARILRRGLATGHFGYDQSPERLARLILAALQGALLVKRTTDDPGQLDDAIEGVRDLLRPG